MQSANCAAPFDERDTMRISAQLSNSRDDHQVTLFTNDSSHTITIHSKANGKGSRTNGGELLFLALATCYCNDIYREADKRGMVVEQVDVDVAGDFGSDGDPATGVTYRATVAAHASADEIRDLMLHTDRLAEIQNTLRVATPIILSEIEAISL